MEVLIQHKPKQRHFKLNNGRQLIRRSDLGDGHWEAESDRTPNVWYEVVMNADEQKCACDDFKYRGGICKHMTRVIQVEDCGVL